VTYIGQQPATTFDSGIQDRFTGLSSNTVTLTHDISAETDILVVWNNIVQDSGTYSVGGTGNKTLTLGGTLVSADVVTVYYLNKVMQSVNPTAGSVNTDQLATNAVTNVKMADDAIGVAELSATGTASSSTFLRGDNAWASAGGNMLPAFLATVSATRSISDSTDVVLIYNTEVWDSGGCFDTSTGKFTPTTAGKYFLFTSMRWDTDTDFQISYLKLFKNLTNTAQAGFPNDYYNFYHTSTIVEANGSSDYFLTKAQQNSGGAKNLSDATFGNFFGGYKIIE
tara:strand:+ start:138 stop:983 length:846 start_codon:yes stop_codon:yes gene_type:complete